MVNGVRFTAYIRNGGSAQFDVDMNSPTEGRHKLALAYANNDAVFYLDGVLIGSDSSVSVPSTSNMIIGR